MFWGTVARTILWAVVVVTPCRVRRDTTPGPPNVLRAVVVGGGGGGGAAMGWDGGRQVVVNKTWRATALLTAAAIPSYEC